jgi:hypothetical protein
MFSVTKPLGWSLLSLVDFPSHLSTWLQSASGADDPVRCFCEPPCRLPTSLLQHTVPVLACPVHNPSHAFHSQGHRKLLHNVIRFVMLFLLS